MKSPLNVTHILMILLQCTDGPVVQVCQKAIYYCIKNDFQLLASEQTCFQHIDIANKLVLSFVRGAFRGRSSWNPH